MKTPPFFLFLIKQKQLYFVAVKKSKNFIFIYKMLKKAPH